MDDRKVLIRIEKVRVYILLRKMVLVKMTDDCKSNQIKFWVFGVLIIIEWLCRGKGRYYVEVRKMGIK